MRSLKLEELYTKKFEELVNCIMEMPLIEIKKWGTESWQERIWPQTWQICDADENNQKERFKGGYWWEMVETIREADTGRLKSWGIVACRMWEKEEKPLRVENTQLRSKRKTRWGSVPEIKGGGHFKKEGVANSVKCCRMKLDEKASWLNHWEVNNDFNESGCSKCETLYGTGYE